VHFKGVNVKVFYLLLQSSGPRTLSLSHLNLFLLFGSIISLINLFDGSVGRVSNYM